MFILVDFGGPFYHLLFTAFCADKNYNYCQCLLVLMSKLYINFFCSARCGCWPGSGRRLNSGGHGLRHPVQTRHLWWSNQVKQGVVIFMENKAVHKNVYSILQCVYMNNVFMNYSNKFLITHEHDPHKIKWFSCKNLLRYLLCVCVCVYSILYLQWLCNDCMCVITVYWLNSVWVCLQHFISLCNGCMCILAIL